MKLNKFYNKMPRWNDYNERLLQYVHANFAGTVYCISGIDEQSRLVVKVGYSEVPYNRVDMHADYLSQLKVGALNPVFTISFNNVENAKWAEYFIQDMLSGWKFTSHRREWFRTKSNADPEKAALLTALFAAMLTVREMVGNKDDCHMSAIEIVKPGDLRSSLDFSICFRTDGSINIVSHTGGDIPLKQVEDLYRGSWYVEEYLGITMGSNDDDLAEPPLIATDDRVIPRGECEIRQIEQNDPEYEVFRVEHVDPEFDTVSRDIEYWALDLGITAAEVRQFIVERGLRALSEGEVPKSLTMSMM